VPLPTLTPEVEAEAEAEAEAKVEVSTLLVITQYTKKYNILPLIRHHI